MALFVAAIYAAALIADGVITPAITVTSAIEGLDIVRSGVPVVLIVVTVICVIFLMQQAGTGKIGKFFGSFMLVWFSFLGVMGAMKIGDYPSIFEAFNPWCAIRLLIDYPGWFLFLEPCSCAPRESRLFTLIWVIAEGSTYQLAGFM